MNRFFRTATVVAFLGAAFSSAGCAVTADAPLTAGSEASADGTIVSIDTQPWMYDGNAVIEIDSRAHGRVAVHLPARWNLCKAAAVDVDALRVGMQVRVVASVADDGVLVVCQQPSHRLVPVD